MFELNTAIPALDETNAAGLRADHVSFDAERTTRDGHTERFWAMKWSTLARGHAGAACPDLLARRERAGEPAYSRHSLVRPSGRADGLPSPSLR